MDRPCVYDKYDMGLCDYTTHRVVNRVLGRARAHVFLCFLCSSRPRRVRVLRAFVAMRVEGGDDGRARDVDAREHEMAEIETTYQVIKYEVRTRADVGESAMGDDGWMAG